MIKLMQINLFLQNIHYTNDLRVRFLPLINENLGKKIISAIAFSILFVAVVRIISGRSHRIKEEKLNNKNEIKNEMSFFRYKLSTFMSNISEREKIAKIIIEVELKNKKILENESATKIKYFWLNNKNKQRKPFKIDPVEREKATKIFDEMNKNAQKREKLKNESATKIQVFWKVYKAWKNKCEIDS